MSFVLSIENGPHPGIVRAEILRRLRKMIALLQLEKMEVSFLLTDDTRIWELNKVYRHKNRPTDVLAFAMQEGEFSALAAGMLGDVVVSVPTARRQATSRRIAVLEEVTMLLAHGLLHLLGWDHETPAKDRRMKAETERLCAAARPLEAPSRPKKKSGSSKGTAGRLLTRNQSSPSPAKKANKLATGVRAGSRRPRKL